MRSNHHQICGKNTLRTGWDIRRADEIKNQTLHMNSRTSFKNKENRDIFWSKTLTTKNQEFEPGTLAPMGTIV